MSNIDQLADTLPNGYWFQQKELEIRNQEGWHASISEEASENILNGQSAMTYILRMAEKPYHYFLSYVSTDGNIIHKMFRLEQSYNGWFYRNGDPYISPILKELIPMIMHCKENECHPLKAFHNCSC
jgi:hypothetical protein